MTDLRSLADLKIDRYPVRTCRTMHECDGCKGTITAGQRYFDGGYGRRFHVGGDCAGLRTSRAVASPSPGEGRPPEEPEESPKISRVPWTDAEVENLRRRQAAHWLHPYTGPGHVNLIPSNEGWRLPDSGEIYQQWAWRSDVDGDIGTDPLERLRVASPGEGRPEALKDRLLASDWQGARAEARRRVDEAIEASRAGEPWPEASDG